MKDSTGLNRINKILDDMNYKSAYIEIHTETEKYVLEKEKPTKIIGFKEG